MDLRLAHERAFDLAQSQSSTLLPEDFPVVLPEATRPPPGGVVRSPEELERMVAEDVTAHIFAQASPTASELSGHQQKKEVKAQQAAERDVKRRAKQVASVQGRPGRGNAISSARRRVYRRA